MSNTEFQLFRFGTECHPIVVIDDFFDAPQSLYETGLSARYSAGGRHYPGLRAPARPIYLKQRDDLLQRIIKEVFSFPSGAQIIECNYSIVHTKPEDLTPIQRIPHFDGTNTHNLALLHYLCQEEAGGTHFYRHRSTGFESITQDRLAIYDAALKREITRYGLPPARYFNQSDDMFEKIGSVDARFNRMVIYTGHILHSGDIRRPENIGGEVSKARLTLNTFMQAR